MKLFINDWCIDREDFKTNIEENEEYRLDTWITPDDNHRLYLTSAYLFDEFVMFFYVYELKQDRISAEKSHFEIPQNQRDMIMRINKNTNYLSFEYEVNHLKPAHGSSGECLPRQRPEGVPIEEQDELFEMFFSEYDYLCDLVVDRLPEELQAVPLAFKKDCFSFSEPVTKINHIAVHPSTHDVQRHFINKTFTVPYGMCDIKVPYTVNGVTSHIIIRELKIIDMLKEFEEHYEEFKKVYVSVRKSLTDVTYFDFVKKVYDNNLQAYKDGKLPKNQTVMNLDDIRKAWDERLMTISCLKPEKQLSFEFYTTEYLDSKISSSNSGGKIAIFHFPQSQNVSAQKPGETDLSYIKPTAFEAGVFKPCDKDDGTGIQDGLYKAVYSLGQADDAPKSEYEITLMWVSGIIKHDDTPFFEIEF